ncbi:MAG TPA: nuclear transport factor 2 family protein [Burkholderiaceae bacterium]|nr:nuclear transport factor 2 family protein [Burkholderiaceae bacterium]
MKAVVRIVLGVLPLAWLAACAELPLLKPGPSPIDPVIAAERAFVRDVAEHGLRDGFLRHAAEDSVVFRPQPAPAIASLRAQASDRQRLDWTSERVVIASSGDLAFSTGPYVFALKKDGPISGTGHFFSVWRLGDDGKWRFLIDSGTNHPPMAEHEARARGRGPMLAWELPSGKCTADALQALEKAFLAERRGGAPLPPESVAEDVVRLRQGAAPTSARIFERSWTHARITAPGIVSRAFDLAVFYGEARFTTNSPLFGFVHAWSCEGGRWRLKADVANGRL